jgi:hypothetical protein
MAEEQPWFQRLGPDGKAEPLVARGDKGEILVLEAGGWAASFQNNEWHNGILFSHEYLAGFSPVTAREEVYRLYNQARALLGP